MAPHPTNEPASALLSYPVARRYLGDPSASKFFADLLPELDVVRFGRRSFVTRESVNRLIERHRVKLVVPPAPRTR
jgi:hypothetical protein